MLVSPELVKAFGEGAENLTKVTAGLSAELISEAINLFIVESALNILKFASVFVIFYIVKRYLDAMMLASAADKQNMFKSLKTTSLILSLIFFTTQSFPHFIEMSKALVAPKIFLMEKGASLLKK